ncbi:hypothetical protein EDD18DRAFT_1361009 [Armillaria luteobubalina]|uniref:Uncharacterized protein n=1 Tax=Armillaria luteobubalina TaxID=153913 RepID=A0AA39PKT0_9AGAR|nr:hypothetical protein EDD18DRAFT_1361009 [Armillaria luteobubalina]
MLKEFDLSQELINIIVDELENDHATLKNLLFISPSFRERTRYHIFRVFTLRQYSDHELDLISHLFSEASPIPLLVCSLHIYPFNPALNEILPLLRNVGHLHIQTASRDVLRSTSLTQVLLTYPLTTLHMGEPEKLPLAPSTLIHYGDFFDFVRCFPERIQYVSLSDLYTWEPPTTEDTWTIKGPSVGTLDLRAAGRKGTIFSPKQSGVTIFSAIDQLCFWDSRFESIRSVVHSLPPLSVQKLYIPFLIKKLESTPVKSSLKNLQIILALHLSGLQHMLFQPGSDDLWQSLAERAHRISSCKITITNAVPFFGSSPREWDRIVSRMTTKLRGHFMQAGCSLDCHKLFQDFPVVFRS